MRHEKQSFFSSLRTMQLVFTFSLYLLACSLFSPPTLHAEQPTPPTSGHAATTPQPQTEDDPVELRKTIARLKTEINRLQKRLSDLEKMRSVCSIQDLMLKEEQRSDTLRSQLLAIGEKLAPLESRLDELNEQLRPENIEQMFIAGAVRPEEVREATRRRLSSEKLRLQSQIDLLRQNRSRIQTSLSAAETAIQRLQAQLQETLRK